MKQQFESPIAFANGFLDRADERRGDSDWLEQAFRSEAANIIPFDDLRPRMQSNGTALSPSPLSMQERQAQSVVELPLFLGQDEGVPWFACSAEGVDCSGDQHWIDLRSIAMQTDGPVLGVLAQAKSMLDWHVRHSFCAECGAPTRITRAGYQRTCTREACSASHFPRTDPVVIMLASRDDNVLVGRGPHLPENMYSALAGFMEPGESIEDAVRRELMEETTVETGAVRYFASQPWPFPSSLMIGCFADALTSEIFLDGEELEDARWISRNELASSFEGQGPVVTPPPLAIAHHLLKAWLAET